MISEIDRHGADQRGVGRRGQRGGFRRRAAAGVTLAILGLGCVPIQPEKGEDTAQRDDTAGADGATGGDAPRSDCDAGALQRQIDAAEPGAVGTACAGTIVGNLSLWQDVVLRGHPDGTTLRAAEAGPTIRVISGAATLEDLQIEGGTGVPEAGFSDEEQTVGGGVNAWRSAGLTLRRCQVRDNRAHWGGGVMGSEDGLTILENTLIEGNIADTMAGGVWLRQGAILESELRENRAPYAGGLAVRRRAGSAAVTVALTGSVIESNDGDVQGGGVLVIGEASLTGGLLRGNRSQMGANLHAFGWSGALVDMALTEGQAQVGGGGALIEDSPAASFVRVTVADNQSLMPGLEPTGNVAGGVWVSNSALTVDDSVLQGNSANLGGAMLVAATAEFAPTARLSLRGVRLEGNTADDKGGAIALINGELLVVAGDITGNAAGTSGGGIYLSGGEAILVAVDFSGEANVPHDLQVDGLDGQTAPASGSARCDPLGCIED